MITVLNVAGARPNFMKMAPVHKAMTESGRFRPIFVHTGQHYDDNMSQVFLDDFGLGEPDFELAVGSGTHAQQTAAVMQLIEPVIEEVKPDLLMVYGDVNSTIAAALTAVKLGIRVAHVEAGLRSFDRTMPEEINRILTDAISDFLFAPSSDGIDNLLREGVLEDRTFLVGNVMIDTLMAFRDRADDSKIRHQLGLNDGAYAVATLHRPSNVDDEESLARSVAALIGTAALTSTVLVAHPRTSARLISFGLQEALDKAGVRTIEPLGYINFLALLSKAGVVLTDSGGIQEETTVLGVPCITMRTTTERPVTISEGTNHLVGIDPTLAIKAVEEALGNHFEPRCPSLWDGFASKRIVEILGSL